MKTLVKILVGGAVLVLVAVIGFGVLAGQGSSLAHDAGETAKATAANVALDAGGYKQKVKDALNENRDKIAAATGMSTSQVDQAISDFDIDSWKARPLPNDAVSTGSQSGSFGGMDATITTYQDPNYITVTSNGQDVTLEIPASAQSHIPYLSYLG